MKEIGTFALLIIVGVVFGGGMIILTYVTFAAYFSPWVSLAARAMGYDLPVGNKLISAIAVVFALIGVGIGMYEYVSRRR